MIIISANKQQLAKGARSKIVVFIFNKDVKELEGIWNKKREGIFND